ncbi:MAG: YncE family protein [Terriglobales bacterium]
MRLLGRGNAAILIAVLGLCGFGLSANKPEKFRIVNQFPIEGGGRWDYLTVDGQSRRVYMSRTTHVAVIDADSGKLIGDIADTPGVHGIALAPDIGMGFISAGAEDKVSVFDLKSLKVLRKVPTRGKPDSILYHAATHWVFAQNGNGKSSTVIDARTGAVIATIPLGGKPEFAADDDDGRVFVNIEDKNVIDVVDAASKSVTHTWPLDGCESPSGLAIDRKGHSLFVACANAKLAVVNSITGKVTQLLPIGDDCDAAAFDPVTGYAFASNGDGSLTVVKKASSGRYEVLETVATSPGSKTLGLDTINHRVYLPAAKFTGDPTKRPRPAVLEGTVSMLVVGQ